MLRPIYEFQTVQIELTNACIHSCSNCTRFCGHHKKPFFMEWDLFKKAVDSLEGWPRRIGIMGGEPTLHPEFERFVRYAYEKHPAFYEIGGGHKPIASLSEYIYDANKIKSGPLNKYKGLGLWTSVTDKYYKHYELIQDCFSYQCINDHTASSRHQAWLMCRKEFGIGDEEWIRLRDNCWWQKLLGSPSITPKGAFFCEVAAAMDMLFDGPGGWKVEKDWWKRGPEDFKDQLHWCEFCSGAFLTLDRDANEHIDDVSPKMYEMLQKVESPKLKKPGAVMVHDVSQVPINPRKNWLRYQSDYSLRFTEKNTNLYPKEIWGVTFADAGTSVETLRKNRQLFDRFFVVTDQEDFTEILGTEFDVIRRKNDSEGKHLARIIRNAADWIAVIRPESNIAPLERDIWKKTIFNPGSMHVFRESGMMMFNVMAKSIRDAGYDGISMLNDVCDLPTLWPMEKVVSLEKGYEKEVSPDIEEWNENITKGGIMHFNFLKRKMDDIALRRQIEPQVEQARASGMSLVEKLRQLDDVKAYDCSLEAVCDRLKRAIHQELAKELKIKRVEEICRELMEENTSFCASYALAMLTVGEEKKHHLFACVLDPRNASRLGLATLKLHYDACGQETEQNIGSLLELMQTAELADDAVLVVKRYGAEQLEQIMAAAGGRPCCFFDEEEQGLFYDGLAVLSVRDVLEKYADKVFVWTDDGELAQYHKRLLVRNGWQGKSRELHPLTLAELNETPSTDALHLDPGLLQQMKQEQDKEKKALMLENLLLEKDRF